MTGSDLSGSHASKGPPRLASEPLPAFARTVAGRPTGYSAGSEEQSDDEGGSLASDEALQALREKLTGNESE